MGISLALWLGSVVRVKVVVRVSLRVCVIVIVMVPFLIFYTFRYSAWCPFTSAVGRYRMRGAGKVSRTKVPGFWCGAKVRVTYKVQGAG